MYTLAQRLGAGEPLVGESHEVPFTAQTRMSGVDVKNSDGGRRQLRKGAVDVIRKPIESLGGSRPAQVIRAADEVSRPSNAPLAVAMNSGTHSAKEAGNMVNLDSNQTKLLEVVETGKALLMTHGLPADRLGGRPKRRSCPFWRVPRDMPNVAQRERLEGRNVLVGVIETHGSSETAALLAGLRQLPQLLVFMDLDC